MKISTWSPTRVDFAGGTLDLWPLYSFVGGATTINLSIDIKTYVDLTPLENSTEIRIDLKDLDYKKQFENFDRFYECQDRQLDLVRGHINYWRPQSGFELACRSESPVGGGLGGSSSLSVSLIKAFARWNEKPLSVLEAVTLASNIEAQVLNTPTGTQDYFPALTGGLHFLTYDFDGPREETMQCPEGLLESHMFLVYTGRPHHSGLNNWEVVKSAVAKDPVVLEALYSIRRIAVEVENACRNGLWTELGALFQAEFDARVQLTESFNSPEIDQLKMLVLENGADAIKICGAGGGGCVMVWCQPEKKSQLMDVCRASDFKVFDVNTVRETE